MGVMKGDARSLDYGSSQRVRGTLLITWGRNCLSMTHLAIRN